MGGRLNALPTAHKASQSIAESDLLFFKPFLSHFLCLRNNSHTVKFTFLKCTSQWFLVYLQGCITITTI